MASSKTWLKLLLRNIELFSETWNYLVKLLLDAALLNLFLLLLQRAWAQAGCHVKNSLKGPELHKMVEL
jgi:hypothetical protein